MKKPIHAALLVALILGTGCASIVSRTSREVQFRSTPDRARVSVQDERGKTIFQGETPTIVSLKTGKPYGVKKYAITFSKEGYQAQTRVVRSTLNGWYLGNVIFGGLVGILIVDPLTGAMWTLSPKEVDVALVPSGTSTGTEGPTLNVVQVEDVPQTLHSKMIRVN